MARDGAGAEPVSELVDIFEPGDRIYVQDCYGRIWVYISQGNGTVICVSEPAEVVT